MGSSDVAAVVLFVSTDRHAVLPVCVCAVWGWRGNVHFFVTYKRWFHVGIFLVFCVVTVALKGS